MAPFDEAQGRRLFGTDGVRGVANVDLTPELAGGERVKVNRG